MIVRADLGRGLAHQTRSFQAHLKPDVTVVVDIARIDPNNNWPQTFDVGGIHTTWAGYTAPFDNPDALEALASCDVVYSAETYYDERLPSVVKTVLHVNPEFFRHQPATRYWYPSSWMISDLPPGELVPTPIEDERIATDLPGSSRLLHVGGHRATGDRNGTQIVGGLLKLIQRPWRVCTQDGLKITPQVMRYTEVFGTVKDRWSLYEGCGILVYPRRYGGQSLQVNEAMARGLAVVMGDQSPNFDWPIVAIPTRPGGWVKTPAGRVQMHMVQTAQLRANIEVLCENPDLLEVNQLRSLAWARDNAWSLQGPRIRSLLEDAAS